MLVRRVEVEARLITDKVARGERPSATLEHAQVVGIVGRDCCILAKVVDGLRTQDQAQTAHLSARQDGQKLVAAPPKVRNHRTLTSSEL